MVLNRKKKAVTKIISPYSGTFFVNKVAVFKLLLTSHCMGLNPASDSFI
jgi:hypothetical protein